MNADPLVQPLFDGLIDIVGDIHGEIDATLARIHAQMEKK
jgi:hypothetical protein